MLCQICGISVKSNSEINLHLLRDHGETLRDYYSSNPHATKYCNKCKRELPVTEFYIDQNKASGYRTQCISCIRPEGHKSECPLCHRVLAESAIVNHLKKDHNMARGRAYHEFVKGKRCPKCNTIKPLKDFYKKKGSTYYSYCRRCSLERIKTFRLLQRPRHHSRDVTGAVPETGQGHITSYSSSLEKQENDTLRSGARNSAEQFSLR